MNEKEWTIMIYMSGDNNLAADMVYSLEQIRGVVGDYANSPNLFVYYDGRSPLPTLYCDFSDPSKPKYVRSFKVHDKLIPVPAKENENGADKRSVINFVDWCVNKVEVESSDGIAHGRRAKKYAMIFSGHSLGFQDIGLFRDEASGKTMKMTDLHSLLRRMVSGDEELIKNANISGLKDDEIERETAVLLGQKLDILGFDSCVMGMLEVGHQFNDVAKTMIASEGSVPNAGWPYSKILGCFTSEYSRDKSVNEVNENLIREFIKSQDSFTVGGVSVDVAAWDLDRLPDLTKAVDELSENLIECFENEESRIYRQMERVILQVHWKCQSYMYDQNVDLGDFCELLERECGLLADELGSDDVLILEKVQNGCRQILSELQKAVILSGFSGGAYQYSNGVSLFFPWSREGYEVSQKNYESLRFFKETSNKRLCWNGFLKKYLGEVSRRRFEPPTVETLPESRYKYFSGIQFDEPSETLSYIASPTSTYATPMTQMTMTTDNVSSKLAGERDSKLAGERDSKIALERGSKLAGQEGSKIAGQQGSKIAGQQGSKLACERDSKLAGERDSKLAGDLGSKLAGERDSKIALERGSKLAGERDSKLAGQMDSKLAGERDSKLAGERDSKLAGERDSKLAGERDSKLAGERDSKLAGERDSKLAGERDSKLAGERDSKLAGERDSKLAGERDSKLAGERDSKLAGERDSKLAGERDSKLAGERDSKLAGEKDSKLAGGEGASAFFDNLRMFKNIEGRWNISGFSKNSGEPGGKSASAKS